MWLRLSQLATQSVHENVAKFPPLFEEARPLDLIQACRCSTVHLSCMAASTRSDQVNEAKIVSKLVTSPLHFHFPMRRTRCMRWSQHLVCQKTLCLRDHATNMVFL